MATNTEEVLIRLGLSKGPVERGIDTLKSKFSGFAKDTVGAFRSMGGQVASFFAFSALLGRLKALGQEVDRIQNKMDVLDVSSGFVQDVENVASTNDIAAEKVGKAMEKLQLAVAKAREGNKDLLATFKDLSVSVTKGENLEEVYYGVADGLKGIHDPAERAKVGVELFGKAAGDLVALSARGSAELKSLASEFSKFTDAELEEIDRIDAQLTKTENTVKVVTGKIVVAIAEAAQALGRLSTTGVGFGYNPEQEMAEHFEAVQKAKDKADKKAAQAAASAADMETARREREKVAEQELEDKKLEIYKKNASTKEKLGQAQHEERLLKIELMRAKTSEDRLKIQTKMADKQQEIIDLNKKLGEEKAKLSEQDNKALEKAADLNVKIAQARADVKAATTGAEEESSDRYKLTIEELAKVGHRNKRGRIRYTQDALAAQKVQQLESGAKDAASFGNLKFADILQSQADSIRGSLPQLKSSEKPDFGESIKRQEEQLRALVSAATKDGIKIKDE